MKFWKKAAIALLSTGLVFTSVSAEAFLPDETSSITANAESAGLKAAGKYAVKLNKKAVKLAKKGKTAKLKATVTKGGKKVKKAVALKWESSDPAVATVNQKGKVKAMAKGTCYITVSMANGASAKAKVTVKTGTPAKKSFIEQYKEKGGWEVGYEVTRNAQDYLSDGKTREGYYIIKPAKSGKAGSYQWVQSDGTKVTDDRDVVTVTGKVRVPFGRGEDKKPWYFFGKGVTLEREAS